MTLSSPTLVENPADEAGQLPKVRILFLPYQASMWDSMASIWRAAMKDPNADVRVMPLPYDHLDSSGFVLQRCAGEVLPAEVAVEHSDTFDIRAFAPDIVYVHNLYDGSNSVTRVLPRFHSRELRRYTRLLVYVPYYIAGGRFPVEQRRQSGYPNADIITLQVPDHVEALPSEFRSRALVVGTPKADAVLDSCLPFDARPRSGASVTVLMTTSITELLRDGQGVLRYVDQIFDFCADRPDIHVIWRPHPLLASTILAMTPGLAPGYARLLRRADESQQVTIDLRPSYASALSAADCYVGFSCTSLALMAGILGVPILILAQDAQSTVPAAGEAAPTFGWVDGILPWAVAGDDVDRLLPSMIEHAAGGGHDSRAQMRRFETVTGPLDGGVGARLHEHVKGVLADQAGGSPNLLVDGPTGR